MSEYAKRKSDGEEIKIGICEEMMFLRFEDKDKVIPVKGSGFGYRWRLPFPDEDNTLPGDYKASRGIPLIGDFTCSEAHAVGCYHSIWELTFVRYDKGRLFPVVGCPNCREAWRCEWTEVLPFIKDTTLKARLEAYASQI